MLFKLYKKFKYREDEEEPKSTAVDPVNDHIMKKNYTHRFKMSKLEKMKILAEHRKRQEKLNETLKEKQKEILENTKHNAIVNDEEPVIQEEMIQLNEEDQDDEPIKESSEEFDYEEEEEADSQDSFEAAEEMLEEDDYYSESDEESSESEEKKNVIFVPKMNNGNNSTFLNKKRASTDIVTPVSNGKSNGKKVCFKLNNNDYNGMTLLK
jgi:hypothetical protein